MKYRFKKGDYVTVGFGLKERLVSEDEDDQSMVKLEGFTSKIHSCMLYLCCEDSLEQKREWIHRVFGQNL